MDAIRLTGIRAREAQREGGAPPLPVADVTLYLDLGVAAMSGDITRTVDYVQIVHRVATVLGHGAGQLLEAVAEQVVQAVMRSHQVQRVIATVSLRHANAPAGTDGVSVTIDRQREHQTSSASVASQISGAEPRALTSAENGHPLTGDNPSHPRRVGVDGRRLRTEVHDGRNLTLHRAVVALCAGVGDGRHTLRSAIVSLDAVPGNQLAGISPLFRVHPAQGEDAVAAVMIVSTLMSPQGLRQALRVVQAAHGASQSPSPSTAGDLRDGEVPLSLTLVDYDGLVSEDPSLDLPSHGAWRQAAVLAPWAAVDPDAVLPGEHGGSVAELLAQAPDGDDVEHESDDWILGGVQ